MRPAPVHEHIYSDGKICKQTLAALRTLGDLRPLAASPPRRLALTSHLSCLSLFRLLPGLNILYNDWNPKLDIKSVCLSLLSMLSSAKSKKRPPDNDSTVVMSQGQKTRNMQWEFHDDKC